MASTGISINKESWAVLREEPLYSARFIDREETDELAVVLRVEMLDWFFEIYPPLTFNLTTWRSSQGTRIAVLSYQLHPTYGGTKGGVFYLNPRQTADAAILRKLSRQESFPVIFLSEDCNEHYTIGVVQDPQELDRWQQLVEAMKANSAEEPCRDDDDSDFAAAVQEFQQRKEHATLG
jgi:hypothetical protein